MGYCLKPCRFTVTIGDGFSVQTTHLITRGLAAGGIKEPSGISEIQIFVCLYTDGC